MPKRPKKPPRPSGSAWIITPDDPATLPVAHEVTVMRVQGPYTEVDAKVWRFLVHIAWHDLERADWHTIDLRDVQKVFRDLGHRYAVGYLWDSLRRLVRTDVEGYRRDRDGEVRTIGSLLADARLDLVASGTSRVRFTFSRTVVELIRGLDRFARIRLHFVMTLSGRHTILLYELLEGVANRRRAEFVVRLDELRDWLGLAAHQYPRLDNLCARVLDPALAQINADPAGAGFSVTMHKARTGRKVDRLVFRLIPHENRERATTRARAALAAGRQIDLEALAPSEETPTDEAPQPTRRRPV